MSESRASRRSTVRVSAKIITWSARLERSGANGLRRPAMSWAWGCH
jgi:hypothetical protein